MIDSAISNGKKSLSEAEVVSKATVKAANLLDINNNVLGKIIGISDPSVSRLVSGTYQVNGKNSELAILFIRVFRGLDAIVGGNENATRSWIRTNNTVLNGTPIQLMQTIEGLTRVVQYIDSRRARV